MNAARDSLGAGCGPSAPPLPEMVDSVPAGRYTDVNPAFARIFGYDSPEELKAAVNDIGQQLYIDPEVRRECVRIVEERGQGSFEIVIRRKDGSTGWGFNNVRAVRDAQGRTICYEGFVEDITDRKRMEEELQKAHSALEDRVRERTEELARVNEALGLDVEKRMQGEETLRLARERVGDPLEETRGSQHHFTDAPGAAGSGSNPSRREGDRQHQQTGHARPGVVEGVSPDPPGSFLRRRPGDQPEGADSAARMRHLVNSLAQHDVYVARYYLRRGAYLAAANRAQGAVRNFPNAPANEEALFVMKQSYDKLKLFELRDDASRVLEKNFPQSPYLKGDVRRYAPWWRVWDPER